MTGRKGEALKVEGKQNSLLPIGAVIKCFVIPPNLKNKTNYEKHYFLDASTCTNLC